MTKKRSESVRNTFVSSNLVKKQPIFKREAHLKWVFDDPQTAVTLFLSLSSMSIARFQVWVDGRKNNQIRKTSYFPRLCSRKHCFYVRFSLQKKRTKSTISIRSSSGRSAGRPTPKRGAQKRQTIKLFRENFGKPYNNQKRKNYIVKCPKCAKSFFLQQFG